MTDKEFAGLVTKVAKARKKGLSWLEIQEQGLCTRGQIAAIRKEMRKRDPKSVSNSGPRSAKKSAAKPKAKKTTSRKHVPGGKANRDRVAAANRRNAKKSRTPKGQRPMASDGVKRAKHL